MRAAVGALVVLFALALAVPAAPSGDGDDESRVRVACLGGTAELRLRAEEDDGGVGTIEVELRVDVRRAVSSWRVVLLHERRLVFQGTRRSSGGGYSFRLRRVVPDWPGIESVSARLTAPSGRTCRVAATI